jgi:hypothetical protein
MSVLSNCQILRHKSGRAYFATTGRHWILSVFMGTSETILHQIKDSLGFAVKIWVSTTEIPKEPN